MPWSASPWTTKHGRRLARTPTRPPPRCRPTWTAPAYSRPWPSTGSAPWPQPPWCIASPGCLSAWNWSPRRSCSRSSLPACPAPAPCCGKTAAGPRAGCPARAPCSACATAPSKRLRSPTPMCSRSTVRSGIRSAASRRPTRWPGKRWTSTALRRLWRLGVAAELAGCLDAGLEAAVAHVRDRRQFGRAPVSGDTTNGPPGLGLLRIQAQRLPAQSPFPQNVQSKLKRIKIEHIQIADIEPRSILKSQNESREDD